MPIYHISFHSMILCPECCVRWFWWLCYFLYKVVFFFFCFDLKTHTLSIYLLSLYKIIYIVTKMSRTMTILQLLQQRQRSRKRIKILMGRNSQSTEFVMRRFSWITFGMFQQYCIITISWNAQCCWDNEVGPIEEKKNMYNNSGMFLSGFKYQNDFLNNNNNNNIIADAAAVKKLATFCV